MVNLPSGKPRVILSTVRPSRPIRAKRHASVVAVMRTAPDRCDAGIQGRRRPGRMARTGASSSAEASSARWECWLQAERQRRCAPAASIICQTPVTSWMAGSSVTAVSPDANTRTSVSVTQDRNRALAVAPFHTGGNGRGLLEEDDTARVGFESFLEPRLACFRRVRPGSLDGVQILSHT